jgi:hypothetical protein
MIARALEAANLKGDPEWQEEGDELIAALWRAASIPDPQIADA